ncbi:MAG: hypothetical protein D6767_04345, partial [Candidatus Hydrogenedentota bacterium]
GFSNTFFLILFFVSACKSFHIINPPTYDETKPYAIKGEQKAWMAIEQALFSPTSKADFNTKVYMIRDLGAFSTSPRKEAQKALAILEKGLHHKKDKLRAEFVRAYFKLGKKLNRSKTEKKLLKAIAENKSRFQKVLPAEIEVLGNMENKKSTEFLQDLLGEDPTLDPLIIQAIGKKLPHKQSRLNHSTLFVEKGGDTSLDEEDSEPEEESSSQNSGRTLMEYLNGDYPLENKVLSLKVLARSQPNLLFRVAISKAYSNTVRIEALRLLADLDLTKDRKKKWTGYLKKLYLYSEGNIEVKEAILQTVAVWQGTSPVEVLKKFREAIWKKRWAKERALMRRREYLAFLRKIRSLPKQKALAYLFIREGLSKKEAFSLVTNMEHTVERSFQFSKEDSFRQKVFWAALRQILPKRDYFQLKQYSKKAFSLKNFVFSVMGLMQQKWRDKNFRRILLARLWGISRSHAVFLDKFYLKKQMLLARLSL